MGEIDEVSRLMAEMAAVKLVLSRAVAELSAHTTDRERYIKQVFSIPRVPVQHDAAAAEVINETLDQIEEVALVFALGPQK